MSHRFHIVLTTINIPSVIVNLLKNVEQYGHINQTKIWVVGDVQTPEDAKHLCQKVSDQGLEVIYLDIASQNKIGKKFEEFYERLPLRNESRRNIGYLAAYEDGAEILISMDDDNFPLENDFIGGHQIVGSSCNIPIISDSKGFYNICEHLELEPNRKIYPRGFPFELRDSQNEPIKKPLNEKLTIGVNAGLWIKDPDIDATTWLNGTVQATNFKGPDYTVLDQETWTPINTQNTAVVRDLIPAYICIPMGWDVPGGKINRYGDIWGGYFLQSLMRDTEYVVSFGNPIVEHRRNPHNYVEDLRGEYWGLILTDWLLENLRHFSSKESNILDRISDLSRFIEKINKESLPKWCPIEVKKFLFWTSQNLREWKKSFETLI
jgi:hypothetical protein